jgi:hypothetical protein
VRVRSGHDHFRCGLTSRAGLTEMMRNPQATGCEPPFAENHEMSRETSTRVVSVIALSFREPGVGARELHFRSSNQLQIPRFARNDNGLILVRAQSSKEHQGECAQ